MKHLLCCMIFGVIFSSSNAAIVKMEDGRKGKIDILDTASLTDTLVCEIITTNKTGGKMVVNKRDIIYLIVGTDTLHSNDLHCTRLDKNGLMINKCMADSVCKESYLSGQKEGALHNTSAWGMGGFASGLFCGPIGSVIIMGMASSSQPKPPPSTHPDSLNNGCYELGYTTTAVEKSKKAACNGSYVALSIAVSTFLIFMASMIKPGTH